MHTKQRAAYTYVIASRRRRTGERYSVSAVTAHGDELLGTAHSFRRAMSVARFLAGRSGSVEVRV